MHNSTRWNTTHGSDCELKLKCFLLAKFIKVVCPCIHISFIVNESEKEHKSIEQKEKNTWLRECHIINMILNIFFLMSTRCVEKSIISLLLSPLFCVVCRKTYKNKLCYKFICTKKKKYARIWKWENFHHKCGGLDGNEMHVRRWKTYIVKFYIIIQIYARQSAIVSHSILSSPTPS